MDAFKSGNDALLEAAQDIYYPCDFVGKNISDVLASARPVHYMDAIEVKSLEEAKANCPVCICMENLFSKHQFRNGDSAACCCQHCGEPIVDILIQVPVDSREGNS